MIDPLLDIDAQKKAEKEKKDQEFFKKRRISDLRKLLKQPEFRRFIWDQLSETGLFRASFTSDARISDWNEGKRDIGLKLLVDLNEADIKVFAQIQSEFVAESIQREKEALKQEENQNDD
jgi:hypothetical protein